MSYLCICLTGDRDSDGANVGGKLPKITEQTTVMESIHGMITLIFTRHSWQKIIFAIPHTRSDGK